MPSLLSQNGTNIKNGQNWHNTFVLFYVGKYSFNLNEAFIVKVKSNLMYVLVTANRKCKIEKVSMVGDGNHNKINKVLLQYYSFATANTSWKEMNAAWHKMWKMCNSLCMNWYSSPLSSSLKYFYYTQ